MGGGEQLSNLEAVGDSWLELTPSGHLVEVWAIRINVNIKSLTGGCWPCHALHCPVCPIVSLSTACVAAASSDSPCGLPAASCESAESL